MTLFMDTSSRCPVPFLRDPPPAKYAVLSYSRSRPLRDWEKHVSSHAMPASASTPQNLAQACRVAREHGIPYLWVHDVNYRRTASGTVLASWRRIREAHLVIALLEGLIPPDSHNHNPCWLQNASAETLSACGWFQCAWSLQDLVGSRSVTFFDSKWNLIGAKSPTSAHSWLQVLSRASGVDVQVLADRDALSNISLGRRISWAARRESLRPEDVAYSLAGICGIGGQFPPRYGEGGQVAFQRLLEALLRRSTDLSLLAWVRQQDTGRVEKGDKAISSLTGILAKSPAEFRHFGSYPAWATPFRSSITTDITFSNRGLVVHGLLSSPRIPSGELCRQIVLVLKTPVPGDWVQVGITLGEVSSGLFARVKPHEVVILTSGKASGAMGHICIHRSLDEIDTNPISTVQGQPSSRVLSRAEKIPLRRCLSVVVIPLSS
ncbi:hypothetical protein OQA88_13417 [Cercophora sp. LCS_1]